jgi:hypothetical protein
MSRNIAAITALSRSKEVIAIVHSFLPSKLLSYIYSHKSTPSNYTPNPYITHLYQREILLEFCEAFCEAQCEELYAWNEEKCQE